MAGNIFIVGIGEIPLNPEPPKSATTLMVEALRSSLSDAGMAVSDLDGLVALSSLADPGAFMQAHVVGTLIGLVPQNQAVLRTVDTCGAGAVTALLEARRMIRHEGCEAVAVVAGDTVHSLPTRDFLARADSRMRCSPTPLASPTIPLAYDLVAQWHMRQYGLRREQLAMASCLMSLQAARNPTAAPQRVRLLEEVLAAPAVGAVTGQLECALRADGGAAFVLASEAFLRRRGISTGSAVAVKGGAEASGPMWPSREPRESDFCLARAAGGAYREAGLTTADIHFFGIYDCFPIALIRGIEAVGLAETGRGGDFVEEKYQMLLGSQKQSSVLPQEIFPINTHGGLLAFGAPWAVPGMYNVLEAVRQLRGTAGARQVSGARNALATANGGIFSAYGVVVLSTGRASCGAASKL